MEKDRPNDSGVYQKTDELFEFDADDMTSLARNPLCVRLIGQQIAAADSTAANIDQEYGRGTKKGFAQTLLVARGNAREVRGRCIRMKCWLGRVIAEAHCKMASEIIATVKKTPFAARSRFSLSLPQ